MTWHVVRWRDTGEYAILHSGSAQYHLLDGQPLRTPDMNEAARIARQLAKPGITQEDFDRMTSHVPMRDKTRLALHAVMVGGYTWRAAATRHNITESGILRAMRRITQRNPTTAERLNR